MIAILSRRLICPRTVAILCFFTIFLFLLPRGAVAAESPHFQNKKVLFLSSYHPGFDTYFRQLDGIREILSPAGVELDVEFMDTKRFNTRVYRGMFYRELRYKFHWLDPYDAIIAADDAALRFALDYRDVLFEDIPVVFCGVNDRELALAQNDVPFVTGVIEAVSMRETLELVRQLQPHVHEVFAIVDDQIPGQADLARFLSSGPDFPDLRLSVLSLEDLSWDQLESRLSMLDADSAVLLLSAFRDREYITLDFDEALQKITGSLNVPLYHLWYHGLGDGVLGGKVVSHFEQGRSAARIVLEIFKGVRVGDLPVVTESPNRYVFDYEELRRFEIPTSSLPADAGLVNRPYSFYREHRGLVLSAGAVLLVFLAIIGGYSFILLRMHRAEASLRETEARYRTVFDNASEGIIITDVDDWVIRYVNPALCRFLDYSAEELQGMSTLHIHPVSERDKMLSVLCGTAPRPGEVTPAIAFQRKGGEVRWGEEKWARIHMDGVDCILGFITDITERKKLDEELEGYRHDLERRVEARTAELKQSRREALDAIARMERSETNLVRAKEEADAANQAKGEFLANMSHEIRTPLNAVIGMTRLMQKDALSPRQRDYLFKIDMSAKTLLGVIDDILDLSKIEAGKLQLENVPFSLEETVTAVVEPMVMQADQRGIELHVHMDVSLPGVVVGDPLRLGQILNNLLNNAVKFTREGDVILSVGSILRKGETQSIQFVVRDTGVGMSKEQQRRVFDSFTQADSSTTRRHAGTGLGLTICKQLCDLMGGEIAVESEPDRGSTFTVTLPFGVAAESREVRQSPEGLFEQMNGVRVLVADDNPVALKILAELLRSLAFDVKTVDSGEAALEALREAERSDDPFRVVVLDWKMAGMDGIETARRIRSEGFEAGSRLLMVTAYRKAEVADQAREAGFDDILEKPVHPSAFFESVVRLFAPESFQEKSSESLMELPSAPDLRGKHLLLAEDNEINRQLVVDLLKDTGARITEAADGRQAVEAFASGPFDLVLMDVQMPELDGLAATKEIRRMEPRGRDIPILAMTAHAMTGDRERCLKAGMDEHLTKPIEPSRLMESLRRWLPADDFHRDGSDGAMEGRTDFFDLEMKSLDRSLGLHRSGGRTEVYLDLLRKFRNDLMGVSSRVSRALQAGNRQKALWETHRIRGVAGSLGAISLQARADLLEQRLRSDESERYEEALAGFCNGVSDVLADLNAGIPVVSEDDIPDKNSEARGTLTCAEARDILSRIGSLLKKSQPRAVLELIEGNLWPGELQVRMEMLKDLVSSYRLEEAFALWEGLKPGVVPMCDDAEVDDES